MAILNGLQQQQQRLASTETVPPTSIGGETIGKSNGIGDHAATARSARRKCNRPVKNPHPTQHGKPTARAEAASNLSAAPSTPIETHGSNIFASGSALNGLPFHLFKAPVCYFLLTKSSNLNTKTPLIHSRDDTVSPAPQRSNTHYFWHPQTQYKPGGGLPGLITYWGMKGGKSVILGKGNWITQPVE